MSRGGFIRTAAGAAAMATGAGLLLPSLTAAAPDGGVPLPIPGGTDLQALLGLPPGPLYHFYFPVYGNEVATVNNINGFVAAAELHGSGTATNTLTGVTTHLTFDTDMRFIDGIYVGQDGRVRRGTFGFI